MILNIVCPIGQWLIENRFEIENIIRRVLNK